MHPTDCAVCGVGLTPPVMLCSACGSAGYCSRECQLGHWKSGHRAECAELAAPARRPARSPCSGPAGQGSAATDLEDTVSQMQDLAARHEWRALAALRRQALRGVRDVGAACPALVARCFSHLGEAYAALGKPLPPHHSCTDTSPTLLGSLGNVCVCA